MPECSGNNQLGRPGEPLEPFMATFHEPDGEPIIGMPIKFVIVKGGGQLEVADERTNYCGGVCAELVPDGTSKRGRVELRYGENFEQMIPFVYSLEGVEEEAIPLPAPAQPAPVSATKPVVAEATKPPAAAPIRTAPAPRPAPVPATRRVTATIRVQPSRPAAAQQRRRALTPDWIKSSIPRSHSIKLLMIAMLLAMTIPVYGFVHGVSPLFFSRTQEVPPVDLFVDCSKASAPKAVGHRLVYSDCQLLRR